MGRLALPLGSFGEIQVKEVGSSFEARCRYRRMDGTYSDVRRRRKGRDRAKQAVRDAISDMLAASPAGTVLTAQSQFGDAADLWLSEYRADAEQGIYSFGTVDTYADVLRNHVRPALGNLRLFEVRPPVINALCQSILKANSLSLARHVRAVIGNVMTYAVQVGAVEANPVREIAPLTERKAKTKRKKARALTAEELLDLLAKLDADEEALRWDLPDLVRLFVATGERRGEALGAHWSDFDPEKQVLTMTGNIISARGKGTIRNKGKSEASDREISLPDWCVRMLQERYATIGEVDPDKPIFTNTRGGYLNASNLTNRVWVPFRRRAGFEWVTFHTFRKTVATLLDDAGLTARQVADVLGHSHPSMTLNTYMGRGQVSRAGAEALSLVVKTADPKVGDKLANRSAEDSGGQAKSEA